MREGPSMLSDRRKHQTARELLATKLPVVNVSGKGTIRCHVGTREANESEPLTTHRKE